jgi:hypothetical protein
LAPELFLLMDDTGRRDDSDAGDCEARLDWFDWDECEDGGPCLEIGPASAVGRGETV